LSEKEAVQKVKKSPLIYRQICADSKFTTSVFARFALAWVYAFANYSSGRLEFWLPSAWHRASVGFAREPDNYLRGSRYNIGLRFLLFGHLLLCLQVWSSAGRER
jgi:hypothetical protein